MELQTTDRFLSVTELAGDEVSAEQVQRLTDRYSWALPYCQGKDVVEVACGTGQGLGLLSQHARTLVGGDVSGRMVELANAHYGNRVDIRVFDAAKMPFAARSKDVVIIFEALYYLEDVTSFLIECQRVLRPGGVVLIASANKDLFDFNPSPFSKKYYGVIELTALLESLGFTVKCYGNTPVESVSLRQKVLRPVKKIATDLNLVPKTMAGKKLLKRLMFGGLVMMPKEVKAEMKAVSTAAPLGAGVPDRSHKVIFCAAATAISQ